MTIELMTTFEGETSLGAKYYGAYFTVIANYSLVKNSGYSDFEWVYSNAFQPTLYSENPEISLHVISSQTEYSSNSTYMFNDVFVYLDNIIEGEDGTEYSVPVGGGNTIKCSVMEF